MISKSFVRPLLCGMVGVMVLFCSFGWAVGESGRPNVVWISTEDISSHFGCFGEEKAITPTIDAFAAESVRYTRAFTPHGVCAPTRNGIITGMYPSSIGGVNMRCAATLPESIKCFPTYLRAAGYYCTNQSKEDYNLIKPGKVWDASSNKAHWKSRPAGVPFFAVFNYTGTHESRIWSSKKLETTRPKVLTKAQWQNPDEMSVPPYLPDTDAVRRDYARLFETITAFDYYVAHRLNELKKAGLYEKTIVFIWSDHGDGLPRAKRWLYDSGTLSPLLVRVPEAYRVSGQGSPGSVDEQLVNFIDLGPTVMNLVGVDVPQIMQGRAFLGEDLSTERAYIFGARQRIDQRFDMVRSVRDTRYRYVRNFITYQPYLFQLAYREKCNSMQELRRLHAEGKLNEVQARLLADRRPFEELYDVENDPFEINNLADDPAYKTLKKKLRGVLENWMIETRDTGLLPEPEMLAGVETYGSEYAILHQAGGAKLCQKLLRIANVASGRDVGNRDEIYAALGDEIASVRYWAITALGQFETLNSDDMAKLQSFQNDASAAVRVAVARSLYWHEEKDRAINMLDLELTKKNQPDSVIHFAMEALDNMLPESARVAETVRNVDQRLTQKRKMSRSAQYAKRIIDHYFKESE